ncbi:hypothetical protein [Actinoplanes derwentensis]|uniref:Nitroreductase family protein n=1 Tax=Actinoplanes derwentensis TaxID=113562 RepID=A0A1H1V6Q2_9ACTN|nr:hypothetical protein [Actinoplanes derwentensis]GID89248.1 NAD(P)H nitroreductase [Actinoplanes derwentensis]SDS80392.1 hypothetical protein SAMN04489716_1661 [Actinoplanes derwentensis]
MASPIVSRARAQAFYRAVVTAGRAPSAHNTQPWRWRASGPVLDLLAGPAGHLAMIGCGAALHHARLSLAAQGWRATVERRSRSARSGPLARLRLEGRAPASPGTARLARAVRQRHTDPRPVTGRAITAEEMRNLVRAFHSHDVGLHVLRPHQVLDLAVAVAGEGAADPAEQQWHEQLALWTGGDRIVGAADRGRLPVRCGSRDRAATFAVLHGRGDHDMDWLYAGEALSAGWLAATQQGVSVLPFSAPIERADAREMLRRAVPEAAQPYVMIRLGRHATQAVAGPTSRLGVRQIIDRGTRRQTV